MRTFVSVLKSLRECPEEHHHRNLAELEAYCTIVYGERGEPILNTRLMELHEELGLVGKNSVSSGDVVTEPGTNASNRVSS